MTRERKEEVLLVALVLSCVVHIGMMLYARSRVMTQIASGSARVAVREPMRFTRSQPRPEAVKIEAVPDEAASREAPAVTTTELPVSEIGLGAAETKTEPRVEMTLPKMEPPKAEAPVFDTRPVKLDTRVSAKIPAAEITAPAAVPRLATIPGPDAAGVSSAALTLQGQSAESAFLPSLIDRELKRLPSGRPAESVAKLPGEARPAVAFKPQAVFSAKVDEQLVEAEKKAVKALVDDASPAELKPFVNVVATTAVESDWRYFRVLITPRESLPVMSKDVVLVIDASGSIGQDRMGSIRGASKRLLRTVTNSDDRFNLVAFRDRFSYAFGTWQSCTRDAFERGDKWLTNLAAHGRTDVFSTVRSLLTLPRDPVRPLIALVVTDGDANVGVSDTSELLSRFTALNDGLVSVYMYGVKSSANRELIDVLTHGNRGESLIFDGFRWKAGAGMESLSERFRDPVLSDIRILATADARAEAYPRRLRNLYRGDAQEWLVRVPASVGVLGFSLRGLNGGEAYEGFFRVSAASASADASLAARWQRERNIDVRLR